ncbi:MAG: CopG family antitoxin [Candidatus Aquicultor sp.]
MSNEKKKIPHFKNEEEEREFWQAHSATEFLDDMEDVTDEVIVTRPKKRLLSFRIDDEVIERLQKLARRKGIGYQTLMRVWVMERLEEEEKRAG